MVSNERWTVQKMLAWCTDYFKKKQIETAKLDAELLLAHALKIERIKLYVDFAKPLNTDELDIMHKYVKRRAAYEPVAYITGHKEFFSLDFIVTKDVLIPRPDTELLIEKALAADESPRTVLDYGTGSGCIAVTLAHFRPNWSITAVDISEQALAVARQNAEKHDVADRIIFKQVQSPSDINDSFDMLISNPPYIPSGRKEKMQKDVVDYEPHMALFAGEDGMSIYTQLINSVHTLVNPNGRIILETDPLVISPLHQSCETGGLRDIEIHSDLAHLERCITAVL